MGKKINKIKSWSKFLNESKVASDESPIGFYHICNSLKPDNFFSKLNELGIEYKHDGFSNFIEVFVSDINEGSIVRELSMSDIFEADDIAEDDMPYMVPGEIGDVMEIKIK